MTSGGPTAADSAGPRADGRTGRVPATFAWWVGSVGVALVHNGLWATPNLGFMALIAQNPGANPFPVGLPGDYLLTGISMPTLAAIIGQTEAFEIARLHLVVLLVGWAAVVALAHVRRGHATARNLTVLLAAAPVVTVSMQWLGQPDPVTAMCGIAMVLVIRRRSIVVLGLLAGLTHPEQALFMAAAAGVLRSVLPAREDAASPGPEPALSGYRWSQLGAFVRHPPAWLIDVVTAAVAVLLGRLITQVWLWLNDITIRNPRISYPLSDPGAFWSHHMQHPLMLLWSLWGPLWLVVGWLAVKARGAPRPSGAATAAWTALAVATAALFPVFLTLDETRVYAVITAPLLAVAAAWCARLMGERSTMRASVVLLALTALIPGVMATGTYSTRADLDTVEMVSFLVDGAVPDRFVDPDGTVGMTEWLIEPFDIVTDRAGG